MSRVIPDRTDVFQGTHFFRVADFSDETWSLLVAGGKAAMVAYFGVSRALRHQARRGRTKEIQRRASQGTVEIGVKALCRATGRGDQKPVSPATMRKGLRYCCRHGLLKAQSQARVGLDRRTGRIVRRTEGGPMPPVVISLTISPEQLRPTRRQPVPTGATLGTNSVPTEEPKVGTNSDPLPERDSLSRENTPTGSVPDHDPTPDPLPTPSVTSDAIPNLGTTQDTAEETGRLTASKAVQEGEDRMTRPDDLLAPGVVPAATPSVQGTDATSTHGSDTEQPLRQRQEPGQATPTVTHSPTSFRPAPDPRLEIEGAGDQSYVRDAKALSFLISTVRAGMGLGGDPVANAMRQESYRERYYAALLEERAREAKADAADRVKEMMEGPSRRGEILTELEEHNRARLAATGPAA